MFCDEGYRFPEIKNIPSVKEQLGKIGEEIAEMCMAIEVLSKYAWECGEDISTALNNVNNYRHELLLECLDTIHAVESLLRKFGYTDDEVYDGIEEVIIKNEKRGYYGEEEC